jgi:hypothetical protein
MAEIVPGQGAAAQPAPPDERASGAAGQEPAAPTSAEGLEPQAQSEATTSPTSAAGAAPKAQSGHAPSPTIAGAGERAGQGHGVGPQQPRSSGGAPQGAGGAEPEGWSDIHLDDILKGFGALIGMVSGAVEAVGSAFQGPSYTRPLNTGGAGAPATLGAGSPLAGVRDPVVEIFDEGDEIMLIVEWPYGEEEQILVEARDDILCLSLAGEFPYSTEILLPGCVEATPLSRSYRNGILEVRLRRI